MANPFSYCELHTTDAAAARAFYGKLFDWKFDVKETPFGQYTSIKTGEGPEGGLMKAPAAPQWLTYVLVGDLAASTRQARDLGAKILEDKVEVPNVGWFTLLQDPAGASFAMWEKKPG
jgi:predicted enzyme related to lactoylglutathione lyase